MTPTQRRRHLADATGGRHRLAARMVARASHEAAYTRALAAEVRRIRALTLPVWREALRQIEAERAHAVRFDARADAPPDPQEPDRRPDPVPTLLAAIEAARMLLRREWAPRVDLRREAEPIVDFATRATKGAVRATVPAGARGAAAASSAGAGGAGGVAVGVGSPPPLGFDPMDRVARIDVFADTQRAAAVERWVAENAQLVTSIPETALDRLVRVVQQEARTGTDVKTLAKIIERNFQVTESRARLIARDQTAKLNGTIQREAMQASGSTKYVWSTSQDERVRDEHRVLDGQTFAWNDPPPAGPRGTPAHPMQAIQCRCVALPVYDDLPDEADLDRELSEGLDVAAGRRPA